jgi:hypothetical protein
MSSDRGPSSSCGLLRSATFFGPLPVTIQLARKPLIFSILAAVCALRLRVLPSSQNVTEAGFTPIASANCAGLIPISRITSLILSAKLMGAIKAPKALSALAARS